MAFSEKGGIWTSRGGDSLYGGPGPLTGKIRILIVDDHAPYREGLRSILELEPDMDVVGEAGDGTGALEQVGTLKPDIVLMDLNMPGMGGMSATRKLTDEYPGILVILLTMFKGDEHLREARRAGASAYVLKDAGGDILVRTIREVMAGETPILQREEHLITGPALKTSPLGAESLGPAAKRGKAGKSGTEMLITSNERAILRLLAAGSANDEISAKTGLSESMVRTYLDEIYRKLGLPGREAAARFAREHGLTEEQ